MTRFHAASLMFGTLAVSTLVCAPRAASAQEKIAKAVCVVQPTEGNKCRGVVRFEQADNGVVTVTAEIAGLTPGQKHAIHIHQFGDVTDLSGKSAGGHYNPEKLPHGLPPAKKRHAGDLGNLEANAKGVASLAEKVDNISIAGKNAILGRAIVIHAMPDDGGQPTGNAGGRIGFGVIGVAAPAE